MNNYLNLLGLAFRAGKCSVGEDAILRDVRSEKAKLVILARDTGDRTKKRITDKCKYYRIPYIIVEDDRETLSNAIGKSQRVAIAILDAGFAKKISSYFDR
ncbi:L7Ae/L30e/S12e/Gadd45 family ribosomal protein [Oceanobacillus alkalisoli]|uniref:L7Ae/L30e/S12e/Gadd45 family ribosomal protein n=1 Tax=Oceanobacillus alkalisoli TaxID=2925113 RepID=UPI001EEFB9E1|nr:ribosomal L7Ae/L30e/S12e/Gadd45 family protein [Oceanobacillus alkalisoli]MCF3942394.1 ribosomal L7Ae/L30e/S12e/Gadd45 family protein [Oceanobacillus alkalisoli]MCG5103451.1 ribosomal L7Ae/L30e/S12e/Gadd45 family protein [Oceanobacillus alkalisoli]